MLILADPLAEGMAALSAGDVKRGGEAFIRYLGSHPEPGAGSYVMGLKHFATGSYTRALEWMSDAETRGCASGDFFNNLGYVLIKVTWWDEAARRLHSAADLLPTAPEPLYNLATVHWHVGLLTEARRHLERARALRSSDRTIRLRLARLFAELKDFIPAEGSFEKTDFESEDAGIAFRSRGLLRLAQGRLDEALSDLKAAIDRGDSRSYNPAAKVYLRLARTEEAAEAVRQARKHHPDKPDTWWNQSVLDYAENRMEEAVRASDLAFAYSEHRPRDVFRNAVRKLDTGKTGDGWKGYEARRSFVVDTPEPRRYASKLWLGQEAGGESILIYGEQGYGDTLQFIRYVPDVVERKLRVTVAGPRALKRILQRLPGVLQAVDWDDQTPGTDWNCPVASLPFVFGTDRTKVAAKVPYVQVESRDVLPWGQRLRERTGSGSPFYVGIAWATRPAHPSAARRSVPFEELFGLARVSGVCFVSLQKDPPERQSPPWPGPAPLVEMCGELSDFYDTACLMQNLDLVITADSAPMHLAGALGKPVWVLLSAAPDALWEPDLGSNPWYPTLRVFKQKRLGDWSAVIHEASTALRHWVASGVVQAPTDGPEPNARTGPQAGVG